MGSGHRKVYGFHIRVLQSDRLEWKVEEGSLTRVRRWVDTPA